MIGFGRVCCGEYEFLYLFKDPGLGRVVEEHLLGLVFREKLSLEEYKFEQESVGWCLLGRCCTCFPRDNDC
jgi:hypothetical protein